uniref:Rho GDP dissociation inhibitor (GDI) gamma n=1 Tax=Mastacembelus armatus TaxID=205130 RepID=A0A7N8YK98_9TELE
VKPINKQAEKLKQQQRLEEEDERNLNYNPPAQKSLQEIQQLDKDDESLVKYKQTLLGTAPVTAVDKVSYMVGSYGPKAEEQEFLSPLDEAPKGLMTRGHYQIKSCFIDDDKNVYLSWEWNLDIKKDWNE